MDEVELYNNLKVFRAKHNLTQAELADRIGVTRTSINAIETRRTVPSTILALRIAQEFRVSVEELFYLELTPPSAQSDD